MRHRTGAVTGSSTLLAEGLAIRRRGRVVVRDVALRAEPGTCLVVAGPNGAGKSTLLRTLAGVTAPAAGRLEQPAGGCADVPEQVALAPTRTAGAWTSALRRVRGLPAAAGDDRPLATLSKGQLQRVVLEEALASGAPLLVLDEPFAGLDADARAWLAGELDERLAAGTIVVLTDHTAAGGQILHPRRGQILLSSTAA